ncbi:PhzF family phenazine biosynthesis protein, partial [Escherichia coli]|nr:PhzF family phenazine biosynthesis protein [Escherichia coli]
MKPQVYHVDAFTSQPFRGNSAGVVFPADNLSEAQMQLIARELGHSERGARRIRKKSYAKVFRASVRAETSRLPVCGSAARRNR